MKRANTQNLLTAIPSAFKRSFFGWSNPYSRTMTRGSTTAIWYRALAVWCTDGGKPHTREAFLTHYYNSVGGNAHPERRSNMNSLMSAYVQAGFIEYVSHNTYRPTLTTMRHFRAH